MAPPHFRRIETQMRFPRSEFFECLRIPHIWTFPTVWSGAALPILRLLWKGRTTRATFDVFWNIGAAYPWKRLVEYRWMVGIRLSIGLSCPQLYWIVYKFHCPHASPIGYKCLQFSLNVSNCFQLSSIVFIFFTYPHLFRIVPICLQLSRLIWMMR